MYNKKYHKNITTKEIKIMPETKKAKPVNVIIEMDEPIGGVIKLKLYP